MLIKKPCRGKMLRVLTPEHDVLGIWRWSNGIKTRIKHNNNLANLLQPTQPGNNKHLPSQKIVGISTQLDFIYRFINPKSYV